MFHWILTYVVSNHKSIDIIDSDDYIDLIETAKIYQNLYVLDSCALLLVAIKLIGVLRINRYIHWALTTIEKVLLFIIYKYIGNITNTFIYDSVSTYLCWIHICSLYSIWSINIFISHIW
jgi:hypothetical protein